MADYCGTLLALFLYLSFTRTYTEQTYPLLIPMAALSCYMPCSTLNTKMLFSGKKFLQHPVLILPARVKAIAPASPGKRAGMRFQSV